MNKKLPGGPAAVIEIGSSAVRMRVSQLKHGEIEMLDSLEYPVFFGHEVFTTGRISFESLRQLSSILTKFTTALEGYNCKNVRVVSSTVMREAENRSFVIDQLKIHNNLHLEILEYSEEKALICSEIIRLLKEESKIEMKDALIAYVGTGSIGVALYDGKAICTSQNIPIGSLKLHDALGALSRECDDFYPAVEEYLDIILNRVDIPKKDIRSIILTGSDLELVASVCGAEKSGDLYTISAKKMHAAYKEIRMMSHSAIARRYNISEELAEILYTALSIYTGMLRLSDACRRSFARISIFAMPSHATCSCRARKKNTLRKQTKAPLFPQNASRQNTTATAHIPTPFQSLHARFSTNSKTCTVCQVTKKSFCSSRPFCTAAVNTSTCACRTSAHSTSLRISTFSASRTNKFCSRHSSPAAMSSPCRMLPMQVQSR